jgi:hypothetical protein
MKPERQARSQAVLLFVADAGMLSPISASISVNTYAVIENPILSPIVFLLDICERFDDRYGRASSPEWQANENE